MDLALNNLQRLICHKTKPNQTKMPHTLVRKPCLKPPMMMENAITQAQSATQFPIDLYNHFNSPQFPVFSLSIIIMGKTGNTH